MAISMRARRMGALLLLVAIASVAAAPVGDRFDAQPGARPEPAQERFDRFVVRFRDDAQGPANAALRKRVLDEVGRAHGHSLHQLHRLALGSELVRTDRKLDADEARALIARLMANPRVHYAEVDEHLQPAFIPNDPGYASQWHLDDPVAGINAPAAWDLSTGAGQVVAVLDTGITPHSDLDTNMLPGYDFISDTFMANDGDGRDGDAADPGDARAWEECGAFDFEAPSSWHGTHVAGLVGAVANNANGVAGVAFGAKIQPVRVFGKCGGYVSDLADAIVWASGGSVAGVPANATPADVISLRFGGGTCSATMQEAIDVAAANHATLVVPAASGPPPHCANVVVVGPLERDGGLPFFYTAGSARVDLSAPGSGSGLWSTSNAGVDAPGAETYDAGRGDGTSDPVPLVAGVVALAQAKAGGGLTPAQLELLLKLTSRSQPLPCPKGCGAGMVDAFAAVTAASAPMLTVSDPFDVAEGNAGTKKVTFTVHLTAPVDVPVSFDIATANGRAIAGSDYVAKSSPGHVIPAGQTSRDFVVTVNADTVGEMDEDFHAVVTNVSGITALDTQGTVFVTNDDPWVLANGVPFTGIWGSLYSRRNFYMAVPAGATNLAFTTSGGTGDLVLYVNDGGWIDVDTYDCRSDDGSTNETCQFPSPVAQGGSYNVMLIGNTKYSDVTLTGSYTPPPTLSIADMSLNEGDSGSKQLTFSATLSKTHPTAVTFDVSTANGSALAGSDYVALNLTGVTIPAGQLSKSFSVVIPGDTAIEPTEYFYVNLANATGLALTDRQAIAYIINNDGALITINDIAVGEGNAGTKLMTFTVKLSQVAPGPVTYNISSLNANATAGSDYVAINLTGQTIPQGQLSKTHSITINGDTTVEDTEVVLVNVRQPTGASVWDGQGIGYILNDDGPTLSIPDASVGEGNSGTKVMNVTVLLSQAAAAPVTYSLVTANGSATGGSDYTAINLQNQTIPAGQLSKIHQITVSGDTAVEANENFTITLGNPTGATLYDRQGLGFIYNDDGPTLSVNDVSISEGNAGTTLLTFTATLSQTAGVPVTYTIATSNLGATAGSDYVAKSVNDSIPAGQLSKTFAVTINGDASVEANETFRVTLSNISTGATLFKHIGTGTITNDD